MWQAPKSRAKAANKRRSRDKLRKPVHISRITGELKVISSPKVAPIETYARILLIDLSPKGVGLFSPDQIMPGCEIVLKMDDPQPIEIRGRVVWCQKHDINSHVISEHPYSYRMGIEFAFASFEEQKQTEGFCEELFKKYLYATKAA